MNWEEISGEKYNWQESLKPETPYNHVYHQTLTMKLLMSIPDRKGGTLFCYDFNSALELIKKIDNLTREIPKIIYLVGCHYNGHDDKYPAFFEVNSALKRPEDNSARDSLIWLYYEAKKYHTTISIHINLTDAYKDSPLWNEYVENDLIAKTRRGKFKKIGVWNGKPAYQILYTHEWQSGYFVKRIEKLIELHPFLIDAGTIHIDAFFARSSLFHGIKKDEEENHMRKIFRYFRRRGIDVTGEVLRRHKKDYFIGLQPMAWAFDQTKKGFMTIPADLSCGGRFTAPPLHPLLLKLYFILSKPFRQYDYKAMDLGFLFGTSAQGEACFSKISNSRNKVYPNLEWDICFKKEFFLDAVIWHYLNRHKRKKIKGHLKNQAVEFSDGLKSFLKIKEIKQNNQILRQNTDIFVPISWQNHPEIIAYSLNGYKNREWLLPSNWGNFSDFSIFEITQKGLKRKISSISQSENRITISLNKNEAISIIPNQFLNNILIL